MALNKSIVNICAVTDLKKAEQDKKKVSELSSSQWEQTAEQLDINGLNSVFLFKLDKDKQFKNNIPKNLITQLNVYHQSNLCRNVVILHELFNLIKEFNKHKIEVLVLKGAMLATTVYDSIGLRAMHDVDILIKKQDLKKIDKILNSSGYGCLYDVKEYLNAETSEYLNSLVYKKPSKVSFYFHVHWHLVNTTLPASSYYNKINLKKLWDKAEVLSNEDVTMSTLSTEHTIIHLCEHVVNHMFCKLILLYDINLFVDYYNKKINWQEVIDDAKDFGLSKFVYYALYMSKVVFKTKVPEDVLEKLKPKISIIEMILFERALQGKNTKLFTYIAYLTLQKSFKDKFEFLKKVFFKPDWVKEHTKKVS